jgi:hypothetical protein
VTLCSQVISSAIASGAEMFAKQGQVLERLEYQKNVMVEHLLLHSEMKNGLNLILYHEQYWNKIL